MFRALRVYRPHLFPLIGLLLAGSPAAVPTLRAAEPSIPVGHQVAEVGMLLDSKDFSAAATVLDELLVRARAGEKLPAGLNLERLLLTAAHTHFQAGQYPRAAELSEQVEKLLTAPAASIGEARLIRGLSLALQKDYAAALPVFRAAETSPAHRDKALLYGAIAAREAGLLPEAIAAYQRLLTSAPRDRDWADAALSLIDLHLRADQLSEARRGLALLRGQLALVDNLAGLNLLSLRLGDALVRADDPAGAITVLRQISTRDALLSEQARRNTALERALARHQGIARPGALEADAARRFETRLAQARASLAELEKMQDFDATLRLRFAHAFQQRGGAWEAALLLEDLLARAPDFPENQNAWVALVQAYAEAGRFAKVRDTVDRFLAAHPDSEHAPRALYLAAEIAARHADLATQLSFIELAESRFPANAYTEVFVLLRANALFGLGRYAEARDAAERYREDYPEGRFMEETLYLLAMADLVEGRLADAEKALRAHLKKHPAGRFVPDARHRLAAIAYSRQDYTGCAGQCAAWLRDHELAHPLRGEVLSLRGDALAGAGDTDGAIAAYHEALALGLPDEQLGYVLDELTGLHQSRREFDAAVAMWERFAAERPDHPFVLHAAYWIGRLRAREGRIDEALEAVAGITRRHLHDPARGDVERLLVEFATMLARPPRGSAKPRPADADANTTDATARPAPPTLDELFARASALLLDSATAERPAARARLLFTHAEIAAARGENDRAAGLLFEVATGFAPEELPPGILGKVGDALLARGQPELAREFFERLVATHERSEFADFGHVGLGEIALAEGRPGVALTHFDAAIEQAGARFKLKEATLGRARARLALGDADGARELFEQVAANRAWRGEATAEALFQLGEISARRAGRDDLAKAQAHYQRVYLSYKRYPLWVARSYLRSADTFVALGKTQEAIDTLNRMLSFAPLRARPEAEEARERLRRLNS